MSERYFLFIADGCNLHQDGIGMGAYEGAFNSFEDAKAAADSWGGVCMVRQIAAVRDGELRLLAENVQGGEWEYKGQTDAPDTMSRESGGLY